jgi:hypothetical protein
MRRAPVLGAASPFGVNVALGVATLAAVSATSKRAGASRCLTIGRVSVR